MFSVEVLEGQIYGNDNPTYSGIGFCEKVGFPILTQCQRRANIMKFILCKVVMLFSITIILSCSGTNAEPGVLVTKSEFGNKWPFTVNKGRLECRGISVIFHAKGKAYAVNGSARTEGYAKINEIWKDDQEKLKILKEAFPNEEIESVSVPKISIGPIIDKGLSLCE